MDGANDPEPDRPEAPLAAMTPWLQLFRVNGSATDARRLLLAAIGLVLLRAGWDGLDRAFPGAPALRDEVAAAWEWEAVDPTSPVEVLFRLSEPVRALTAPFRRLFRVGQGPSSFAHAALAALWTVGVWGFVGGAIARVAAVDLARRERVTLGDALRFAARKAAPLVWTPLLPLVGVAILVGLLAGFGLLYRVPGGATAAGVLAFLPLFGGLVLALIVLGLGAGWPLMPAAVAAEAEDSFDAMSRSYAYVYQRPWLYAGYAALAAVLAGVGLVFVQGVAGLVVHLTLWGLGFGGPPQGVATLFGAGRVEVPPAAAATHGFWLGVVGLVLRAWVYSAFFTAATLIYLLLRRDVDGKPIVSIAYERPVNPLLRAAAEAARPPGEPADGARPGASARIEPATAAPGPHVAQGEPGGADA